MRLALRLFKAPNQNIKSPKLWQDPVLGYWETHGKTEFLPNEQYNLTEKEKEAVLWRYRVKEILKREYMRREFDPHNYKYKEGVVMDPAIFRWYSADMTQVEFFRYTPRTMFLYVGLTFLAFYAYTRFIVTSSELNEKKMMSGEIMWWDRIAGRQLYEAGHGPSFRAPSLNA